MRADLGGPDAGSPETLALAQLEAGMPVPGVDIESKTLPPELGPRFDSQYVCYKKGCYSGQEVVMRIRSRGHTNRTWVRLRAGQPLEACAPLVAPDGTEAGHVTQFQISPRLGVIGAGWVRNAWAEPGVRLRSGQLTVEVVGPPAGS
jgi:folate-binding protein YgfZ